jgi:hypothetical protein
VRAYILAKVGEGKADLRKTLLTLYDTCPAHDNFANVDMDDFFIIPDKIRPVKDKEVAEKVLKEKFKSLGPPPPKKPPLQPRLGPVMEDPFATDLVTHGGRQTPGGSGSGDHGRTPSCGQDFGGPGFGGSSRGPSGYDGTGL